MVIVTASIKQAAERSGWPEVKWTGSPFEADL
jgi:hypothetical protein